jgi:ATP-binding cassette, subfamily C, bacterial CydC
MTTARRLLALAGMSPERVALAVGLGALTMLCGVGLITAAGYLISRAAEHPPILALTTTIVVVRFFGLARPLSRYLERLASHDLALRSLGRIRGRIYARLEPLAPGELECYRSGDLLSRMVGDVDALQGLFLRGVGPPAAALVVAAVCVAFAAALSPLAAAILALGLVAGGVGVPLLAAWLARSSGRRQAAARGELTADLVELLRGAPELAVYGCVDDRVAAIRAADHGLTRLARHDALVAGLAEGLTVVVAGLTVTAVLVVAVDAHAAGSLDRVLVATLALFALASFESVASLPAAARELSATLDAGRRVLELTERVPAVRDPEHHAPPPRERPVVELQKVTARYHDGAAVLEGMELLLEPGRKVALVGQSGAGKTTVVNLLLRFLDPVDGRVTIDGVDLRDYGQTDVRATFSLAGQGAHLFSSTIRENLRLARPGATDEELVAALRRARIADWVASLPEGMDTFVGEEGTRLSGGQRQRLVLARALLATGPVLLLDEPTAHLDPETARVLMEDVLDAAADRTVLLITHRREGLEHMDEIVTLDGGRRAAARPVSDVSPASLVGRTAVSD